MIAGISGDLLSGSYLGTHVGATEGHRPPDGSAWMRALTSWWRRASTTLGPASSPRAIFDVGARPLLDLLDLDVQQVESHPWGHAAVLCHRHEPIATLVVQEWGAAPSVAWRHALRGALGGQLPWAVIYGGDSFTVADATRPWSRRVLTVSFPIACRQPHALAAFRALASGSALHGGSGSRLASAIAESDGATTALCASLGRGVLDALQALVEELGATTVPHRSRRSEADRRVLDESLTIVYRLLFLLFAEARQLVPMWHRVYRDAYSVQALCDRALSSPQARGIWSALQAMARLAHVGCHAEDLRVTAFNGRLFAPVRTPLAERSHVSDRAARQAVLALGTSESRVGRRRIAFDDLGVEQLGAVYERVLEYEPVRAGRTVALRPTSAERKTTGSFYTPRAMTDFLVRRTLAPLVDGRSADAILSLRVLDPAMGSGAFLVAACRYLSERVERARMAEGTWVSGEVTDADRAEVARSVAERCLYGIDRNPTAVQLARLSLWLVTLAADRPLTFLDHHLAAGNSLIGARLADLVHPPSRLPPPDDRQRMLFDDSAREAWGRAVVPERHRLALDPSGTLTEVRAKERRLERLESGDGASKQWSRAADIWCGLALRRGRIPPGLYADLQRHAAGLDTALPGRDIVRIADEAAAAARAMGAVHWELLFPEVFLAADGTARPDAGFDAVIGNPPWEVVRGDTGDAAQRSDARAEADALMQFIRSTDHYRLRASGHVNHYQLFTERAVQALRTGGRFGLLLPSGLQSDVGSARLRRTLLDRCRVDTWVTFDNRRAIFPIHRSMRFVLVAGSLGGQTEVLPMSDGGADASCLAQLPDDPRAAAGDLPHVGLPRAFLDRWDPAHLTVPRFTSPESIAVAVKALETPALNDPAGWGVTFGRDLNASDDREHLVPIGAAGQTPRLPVIEGKHLRPFGVDLEAATWSIPRRLARARLGDRWAHPRVCYRDVASASNRVTLMAAVLPAGAVSTHTVFCARTRLADADTWCLAALLNSLVANYLVRLQMSTHVTTTLMSRLPVPRPRPGSGEYGSLVEIARRLAGARAVEDEVEHYTRLNAIVARLYGLAPAAYAHVVSSFPLLPAPLRQRCVEVLGA